jgi:hypothetical protein
MQHEFQLAPRALREICKAGLPGLIHFDAAVGLQIQVEQPITRLRVSLREEGILNLSRLSIKPSGAERLPPYQYAISSVHDGLDGALDLLRAPINTQLEAAPWWTCTFDRPVFMSAITVRNRGGKWAARSYLLCAEWTREDGISFQFDHASEVLIRRRLQHWHAKCAGLPALFSAQSKAAAVAIQALVRDLSSCLIRHFALIGGALSHASIPLGELYASRYAALSKWLDLVQQPLAPDQKTSKALIEIADALIWKGEDCPLVLDDIETRTLPFIFALEYAAQWSVPLQRVQEFERLLQYRDQVVAHEKATEQAVTTLGIAANVSPLMVLPHGMAPAVLVQHEKAYDTSVRDVIEVMAEIGYPAAICHGTLLGAVREERFLVHDDDVDIAFLTNSSDDTEAREELEKIVAMLTARKILARIVNGFLFLKINSPAGGKLIDAFPILRGQNGAARLSMRDMQLQSLPIDLLLPFRNVKLNGRLIPAPAQPEKFLSERFGPNWRTPDRFSKLSWLKNRAVAAFYHFSGMSYAMLGCV